MKIAIIGQSQFGEEVYKLLRKDGHEIVGVFTIPDVKGKPDPLGKSNHGLSSNPFITMDTQNYYTQYASTLAMPFWTCQTG